jgi:hypothetical protein
MCARFGCLPSQLAVEDAELFKLLTLEAMAAGETEDDLT